MKKTISRLKLVAETLARLSLVRGRADDPSAQPQPDPSMQHPYTGCASDTCGTSRRA